MPNHTEREMIALMISDREVILEWFRGWDTLEVEIVSGADRGFPFVNDMVIVRNNGDVMVATESMDVLRGFMVGWSAMFTSAYHYT